MRAVSCYLNYRRPRTSPSPRIAYVWTFVLCLVRNGTSQTFDEVASKLEADAFELRDEVERLYALHRCRAESLMSCSKFNFDECRSRHREPVCPAGVNFHVPACGELDVCSEEFDFTTSTIRFPPSSVDKKGHPLKDELIENICFSQELDNWFVRKRNNDAEYWGRFGFEPRAMYFGDKSGAFRIYPGRHSEICNNYDNRVRPWYVAAGSGPKNIIMVVDKSGTMQGEKLQLMKEAAIRVLDTTTVADRVAVVAFDEVVTAFADEEQYLFRATEENKVILREQIMSLRARGQTNFFPAFEKAFDLFDRSIRQELITDCNSAILFFTDGKQFTTDQTDISTDDVMEVVQRRVAVTSALMNKPVMLLTYSISEAEDVHEFPSELACAIDYGTWSKIENVDQIVTALSSYYLLFAVGLGIDQNRDFAAWVEPYPFRTGDTLGTTVSVPVYDRSKTPHLFLGVVGIDVALEVLDISLGTSNNAVAIERLAARSKAVCPIIDLEPCQLEVYRLATSGPAATCNTACPEDFEDGSVFAVPCPRSEVEYPSDLLDNRDLDGLDFRERACCSVTGKQDYFCAAERDPNGSSASAQCASSAMDMLDMFLAFP